MARRPHLFSLGGKQMTHKEKTMATQTTKWTLVGEMQSDSNPSKVYRLAVDADGRLGCSCPAWIYSHKPCKHLRRWMGTFRPVPPTPAPAMPVLSEVQLVEAAFVRFHGAQVAA
jgi:hypothetical protein